MNSKKNILICGTRSLSSQAAHRAEGIIMEYLRGFNPDTHQVIHGGCSGVDQLAGRIARDMGFSVVVYLADWGQYGKSAGPKRNQQMIDQAERVLSLPCNTSRGTRDTESRAQRAGIPLESHLL